MVNEALIYLHGRAGVFLIWVLLCCWVVPSHAQDEEGTEAESLAVVGRMELSAEELTLRREAVEADTSLSAGEKATALLLYDHALRYVVDAAAVRAEIEAVRRFVRKAPQHLAELEARLEADGRSQDRDSEPLAQIADEALVERTENVRRQLEVAVDKFRERRLTLRELTLAPLRGAGQTGEGLDTSTVDVVPEAGREVEDGNELIVRAVRNSELARAAERRARRDLARERFAHFDLLSRVGFLEVEIAFRDVERLSAQHNALASTVEARRFSEARKETEAAEVAVAAMTQMPDGLRQLAGENLALRRELEENLRAESDAASLRRERRLEAVILEMDIQFAQARLRWAGANPAVGQFIRDRLLQMPSLLEISQAAAARSAARAQAVERRVELERRYRRLAIPEPTIAAVMASIPADRRAELGESWLHDEVRALVNAQRITTEAIYTVNGRYLWVLARLDDTATRIAAAVNKGRKLKREDLLWIRNLPPISFADLERIGSAVTVVSSAPEWYGTLRSALGSFREQPVKWLALFALLVALVSLGPRCRRGLKRVAEQVGRVRTDAFWHTLVASFYTVVLAGTLPLGLVFLGWLARSEPWSGEFAVAVGTTLITAGMSLFVITLLRWACRPQGLSRHYRWPEAVRAALSRELRWFGPLFVIAGGLVVFAEQAGSEAVTLVFGRPASIVASLALAVLLWRLLGPGSALSTHLHGLKTPSFLVRWRRIWYPALQIAPIVLAVSSVLGYYYAAVQLSSVFVRTLWLMIGLLLLRDVLLRWFYVTERRLRLESVLRYREEARAERERTGAAPESEAATVEAEVEEVDYRQLGEQGRAMIKVGVLVGALLGLWILWGDLLPAVHFLERVELPLSHTVAVDGIEREVPVTLSDLSLALLVLTGVLFFAKNLRGLLGYTLLQHLRIDSGASYAIVTLCQYLLVGGGMIYAVSSLGLEWSKLQWLVAALGVGLGFGLQEIVANFVSGIILLLERPVRVGDIVTIGDTDGTVARIRIRATTIVTFERKELVVPNKEFITTRVLNWSLSDAELRLFTVVGIAYGSDVKKARRLILDAATEAEHVLEDPAPIVTFGGFGDNALNIELRCFLPDMDHWHSTRTEINDAIYEKLNDAGIVIAFPQRDVHMDVSGPVDVRLHPLSAK